MPRERPVLMEEMTWPQYSARIHESILILPVGSTEQHGPHLPLGTDTFQVRYVAARLGEALGAIVAPCVSYGYRSAPKSGGGEIFPGTTSLSGATLVGLARDILRAFVRHGARRIVVLDGHYENNMFLHEAIHLTLEDSSAREVRIVKLLWAEAISQGALDAAFPDGFPGWALEHAAHIETSVMEAVRPDLVHRAEIRPDAAGELPVYDEYPQPTDLVPRSGVLADPSRASASAGRMLLEDCIAHLVRHVRRAFDLRSSEKERP
ncbi:MAG: creatininase [Vicinamibacterales bacterium]